jgi:two-component system response regulator FixJ
MDEATAPLRQIVHIVDDDRSVCDSVAFLLEAAGMAVATYETATDFLDRAALDQPGCIVTDIRMPGIGGLDLQKVLSARGVVLPMIIMTGHGDVAMAVQALKAGAVDFIEKPFSRETLIAAVQAALDRNRHDLATERAVAEAEERIASLTPREREVLEGLLAGYPNKTIAYNLGISARTVEVHRARVMEKTRSKSLSDLVRLALVVVGTGFAT